MFLAGKSGSLASKITTTCPPVTLQLTVPVTVYYVYVSIRVWHLIHPWTHDPDCSSHPTTHYLRNNIVYSWPAANLGKIDNCQSPLLLLSNLRMTTWITFWIFFSKIYVSSFHIWYLKSTFFLSKPPQFELDSKVLFTRLFIYHPLHFLTVPYPNVLKWRIWIVHYFYLSTFALPIYLYLYVPWHFNFLC